MLKLKLFIHVDEMTAKYTRCNPLLIFLAFFVALLARKQFLWGGRKGMDKDFV